MLSFVLVGQIWINYQRMLSHIYRSDHWLLWLNLLLLLMVAGYAFPTSVLGEYALKPGAQTVAALIYGSWLSIAGACFPAIWWRAVSKDLVAGDLESQHVHRLPSMHALAHRKLAARQAPGSEAVETVETVQAEGAALSEEQPIAEALEETTPGERGGAHD